jgi:hypothetical protein
MPLTTDAIRLGEAGEFPEKPSKRAVFTFDDSISASTLSGNPSAEMDNCKW